MTNAITIAAHPAEQPPPSRGRAPSLIAELADFRRMLRGLMDPYHPERHYMRGPGPKWHAKHGSAGSVATGGLRRH
jgi:hypothetical protein